MKRLFLSSVLIILCCGSHSQFSSPAFERSLSLSASSGFVFAHSKEVENTKGSHPWGIRADYAWRKTDSATYRKFFGFPTQGVSLAWFNFDNTVLGHGVFAAYFIEPEIRMSKNAGLHFRASAGIIWLSNPHEPQQNPDNNSYSSAMSGYVALGMQSYYLITPHLQLMLGGNYRHTSNGGFKLPNKGINWITADVTLRYFPRSKTDVKPILAHYKRQPYQKFLRWDALLFMSARGIDNESTVRYGVAGAGIQIAVQTGKTHAFTAGAEIYYDIADRQRMKEAGLSKSALKSGIMLGHEFLWGKFIFSQQLGVYLLNQTPYDLAWFHRWGLCYSLTGKWRTGVNLKAHKHVANFPDVRVIYTFSKKEK